MTYLTDGGAVKKKRKPTPKPRAQYQYSPATLAVARRIYGPLAIPPGLETPAAAPAGAPSTATNNPYDLENDPLYQLAISQQKAGLSELGGGLREAIAQALIRFGDPSLVGSGSSILSKAGLELDPQTLAMIDQNYKSGNATLAQLDHAHELRRTKIVNTLAGRNIINSGELGYQEGEETRVRGNQLYDARNTLLDYLGGRYDTFLQGRNSLQAAVNAALSQAWQNSLDAPAPPLAAPPIPGPPPAAPSRPAAAASTGSGYGGGKTPAKKKKSVAWKGWFM